MKKPLLAGLVLCTPILAFAEGGYLDGYYMPSSELKISFPGEGSVTGDGDGFGVRGFAPVSPNVGLTGEYQTSEIEDETDFDQLRLGAGLLLGNGLGVFAEYVKIDFADEPADGFGVHGRLEGSPNGGALNLFGQAGYISVNDDFEDFSGFEFSLGAAFRITQQLSAFVDYRQTSLEGDDSEIELEPSDWRIGARLHF